VWPSGEPGPSVLVSDEARFEFLSLRAFSSLIFFFSWHFKVQYFTLVLSLHPKQNVKKHKSSGAAGCFVILPFRLPLKTLFTKPVYHKLLTWLLAFQHKIEVLVCCHIGQVNETIFCEIAKLLISPI
jgi:hypothetical protein